MYRHTQVGYAMLGAMLATGVALSVMALREGHLVLWAVTALFPLLAWLFSSLTADGRGR